MSVNQEGFISSRLKNPFESVRYNNHENLIKDQDREPKVDANLENDKKILKIQFDIDVNELDKDFRVLNQVNVADVHSVKEQKDSMKYAKD